MKTGSHYKEQKIEAIEVIESFIERVKDTDLTGQQITCIANILKYCNRIGSKGGEEGVKQDIKKIFDYAHRLYRGEWSPVNAARNKQVCLRSEEDPTEYSNYKAFNNEISEIWNNVTGSNGITKDCSRCIRTYGPCDLSMGCLWSIFKNVKSRNVIQRDLFNIIVSLKQREEKKIYMGCDYCENRYGPCPGPCLVKRKLIEGSNEEETEKEK